MYKISPHLNIVETNSGKYAYHSLFGNLVKLKNDDYILLKQLQNNQLILNPENDQLEALHNLHFISSSCEDDYSLLNTVIDKYEQSVKDSHSITKLLLTVTDKCMLACSYCYVPEAPTGIEINSCNNNPICKRNSDMTWDVAKQAIDSFAEIIRENHQKKIHIRFHGGEPLIKYDLIKQSIEYANEIFGNVLVEYHMNTNGILMSKEKLKFEHQ